MSDRDMADRVSVDRKEFQAFLADNTELIERYQRLLEKLAGLHKLNKDLEEKLRFAEQKLDALEQKIGVDAQQADEILRKARGTIARLIEETERRLSE
jgi:predicted  nucleic acid-binding Zn-ribbon protein